METSMIHQLFKVALLVGGGLLCFYLVFFIIKKWSSKQKAFIPALLERHIHRAGEMLFITAMLSVSLQWFSDLVTGRMYEILVHIARVAMILAIAFFIIRAISFVHDLLIKYYSLHEFHDYTLRSVRTKFHLLRRMLHIMVLILCAISVLMTFDQARQLGNTFLASAGIAGIVIGFAAQKSLGTFFAGIQIALTQPIKIDDTVVVEGKFGTIGEITLTYVVINTWDEKRFIVPISYFLENSFENWTRLSPEVVGQVKLYTDYTLPIEELRKQFNSWLKDSPLWDQRKASLLVTGSDDKTIELRMTMSARNSDDSWDLECLVREKAINFLREHYPQSLPTARLNVQDQQPQA